MPLPPNYTGVVLNITDKELPDSLQGENGADEEGEEDEAKVEIKVAEQIGVFDEMMVWKHGSVVDEKADIYVRGVEEWIGFAEAMHYEDDEQKNDDRKG